MGYSYTPHSTSRYCQHSIRYLSAEAGGLNQLIPGSPLQLSAVELIIIAVTPDIPLSSPPRQTSPQRSAPRVMAKREGRTWGERGRRAERGEARVVHKKDRLLVRVLSLSLSLAHPLVRPSLTRSVGTEQRAAFSSLSLCLIECGCSTCTPHTHPQGSPR